jgi:hypothetical protein
MKNKDVFFYIVSGQDYIIEANRSSVSVLEHMGESVDVAAFTPDDPFLLSPGGYQLEPYQTNRWYLAHSYYMLRAVTTLRKLGYERAIFMDTDTLLIAPVPELFDMLSVFDFCGAHAPGRFTAEGHEDSVPESFPELNIGVNPMRLSKNVEILLATMFMLYEEKQEFYGNNDQGPMRDALYQTMLNANLFRVGILTPEYNLRFNFPCFARGEVKILHGRSARMDMVIKTVNASKGIRAWTDGLKF